MATLAEPSILDSQTSLSSSLIALKQYDPNRSNETVEREPVMSASEDRSLLEAIGSESGCKRLALDFYARVATNDELKPLFPGKSLRCATEEFAAFLIQFLDGDVDQTQYRWWLSLRESHSRFQISERQRLAWLRLMDETLDCQVEDSET